MHLTGKHINTIDRKYLLILTWLIRPKSADSLRRAHCQRVVTQLQQQLILQTNRVTNSTQLPRGFKISALKTKIKSVRLRDNYDDETSLCSRYQFNIDTCTILSRQLTTRCNSHATDRKLNESRNKLLHNKNYRLYGTFMSRD